MTQRSSVVPETNVVTEDQFHGAMVEGLGRAIKNNSERALAYVMGLTTTKQLGNIMRGSATHPKRLWDALAAEPSVLDNIATLYGKKLVDQDAICDTNNLGMLLAQLHIWLERARHPDSPGGPAIVHSEKLDGEALLRDAYGEIGRFLEECATIRRPRVAA